MDNEKLKVALVHDFLNQYGGAEKVLEVIAEMFPEAPIYTMLYDPKKMHGHFAGRDIRTSFLQKFPKFLRKRAKIFLPFYPTAPETYDLREFDLVISSSGAWSKGIVTRLNTLHIAYIHSPMRFVWDYNEKYLKEEHKEKFGFLIRPIFSYFRLWDKLSADRPDYLIANSAYTQKRISKYYRRDSAVIYPPVEIKHLEDAKREARYFLIVSRLSAYKKIDKAIEVCNALGLPLWIVGTGKQEKYLKSIAKDNVKFLGWVAEEKMPEIFLGARAFLFPGVDDFGIAPAEAMACGVPVIAIRRGGVQEMVEEGKTGEFFDLASAADIERSLKNFLENEKKYDCRYIAQKAKRFDKERFKKEFQEFIDQAVLKDSIK